MSTLGFEDVAYAADGLDTVFTEFFAKMMNMNPIALEPIKDS